MADPSTTACTKNSWTKVATAVTAGQIEITLNRQPYRFAWVETGAAAPTALSEGSLLMNWAKIGCSRPIDVYIWPEKEDGEVRLHP